MVWGPWSSPLLDSFSRSSMLTAIVDCASSAGLCVGEGVSY